MTDLNAETRRIRLLDPDFLADPYPTYHWLREHSPVHHLGGNFWVASRYRDVQRILRDPTRFSSRLGYGGMMARPERSARALGADDQLSDFMDSGLGMISRAMTGFRVLIATDPPDHTRLRRLVSKAFAPPTVWRLEARVREICDAQVTELLDAREDGVTDLWRHVSYPLPTMVIAEMLGIAPERRADFKRWSDAVVNGLSLAGIREPSSGLSGAMEMWQHFAEVIEERRAQPRDDLISVLVTRGADGEAPLDTNELIMFCILLLLAGNETTTNLLGNFFRAAFAHPGELERLRRARWLTKAAVEEVLRYDSPVQGLWRGTTGRATVGDVELPEDARLLVLFASANRDEEHFGPDAARFRIDRDPTDHVAFGTGIHVCLGQALARLEARVAVDVLLERTRSIEPAADPTPTLSPVLRGVTSQPVAIVAA